ncbi:MAG: hypothetical protein U9R49_00530 [Bacteroidota bacterium]|nr:hypothetical protein [Bacteroidota bacterium]
MKTKIVSYQLLVIAILSGWGGNVLTAQTPFDREYREVASQIHDQIQVFTDRSVYAVDETIHFVADHTLSGPIGANPWSSVLYVELIASNGQPLVQGKYHLSGGRAEGSLHIPGESLTGDYYLKAYTRWMRNQGPGSFSYTAMKIINPFRSEVIDPTNGDDAPAGVQHTAYMEGILDCSTASDSYRAGEEVLLRVKGASPADVNGLVACITVVPEGAIDLSGGLYLPVPGGEEDSFRVRFLPDLGRGVSISGTVVDSGQVPVPYANLHFSLLGDNPDYFATMSDIHGRFVLNAPAGIDENQEFFVTPGQDEGDGLEVRIDEEFDSRAVNFPVEAFSLNMDEQELARKIALNMQLAKAFMPETASAQISVVDDISEGDRLPFYGTRVNRLLIDDYVRLPNLEEVFINLIPEIQFYKQRGVTRIRMMSDNNSIEVYNPLIMIDHVSVFDHEALLALSPDKIERIDLINEVYLKGNVTFGGVLAIHSRKGDMAGIDLPEGSYFFDYQSFQPAVKPAEPAPVPDKRVPDTRNTIFWTEGLNLEQGSQKELSFRAPAHAGSYVILVRGILPDGQPYAASTSFLVE